MNTQLFFCIDCQSQEMNYNQMKVHFRDVHHIEDPNGPRELILHLDGSGFYQTQYRWTIQNITLIEIFTHQKDKVVRSQL